MRVPSALVALVAVAGLMAAAPPPAAAQIDAGELANWADLSTWSRYDDLSSSTVMGVGLVVSGSGGAMRLAFEARLRGRRPTTPPADVTVMVAALPRMDPNVIRQQMLSFELDAGQAERTAMDLASRMVVNNPAPNAAINSAVATITMKEFDRVATAKTIAGNLLGAGIELRPDQIEAIVAFGKRIKLQSR